MLRTTLTITALAVLLGGCDGSGGVESDDFAPTHRFVETATAPGVLPEDPTGPDEFDFVEGDLSFRCNTKGEASRVVPDLGDNRATAGNICQRRKQAMIDQIARDGGNG
jgi:hypothetical protein